MVESISGKSISSKELKGFIKMKELKGGTDSVKQFYVGIQWESTTLQHHPTFVCLFWNWLCDMEEWWPYIECQHKTVLCYSGNPFLPATHLQCILCYSGNPLVPCISHVFYVTPVIHYFRLRISNVSLAIKIEKLMMQNIWTI